MSDGAVLRVDGEVEVPLTMTYSDLRAMPDEVQEDATRYHPKRPGNGVALRAILERARPREGANYLTLHASQDDFHVSIPLQAVLGEAIVVYRHGEEPLTAQQGGPFRFLIKNPAACHTDELDDCANVKYLDRIELTIRKGRDTRPKDEAEHAALHAT